MIKQFMCVVNNRERFLMSMVSLLAIVAVSNLINTPISIYFYFLVVPYINTVDINYAIQNNFSRKAIWQTALIWSILQASIIVILLSLMRVIFHQRISIMDGIFDGTMISYIFIFITAIFAFLSGVTVQTAVYKFKEKYGVYLMFLIGYAIIILLMLNFFWLNDTFICIPIFLILIETITLWKWFKSTDFISRFDLNQQLRNK